MKGVTSMKNGYHLERKGSKLVAVRKSNDVNLKNSSYAHRDIIGKKSTNVNVNITCNFK